MPIDWGVLLNAAGQGYSGYRKGQREQQEQNREYEIADANRLFSEWAKRNQLEFQNRQLDEQSRLRQATIDNTAAYNQGRLFDQERDDKTKRDMTEYIQNQINERFRSAGGSTVQDASGQFHVLPRNQIGPTPVRAPLPESRDGKVSAGGGGGHLSQYQAMRVAGELSDLADIISKARSSSAAFADPGLGNTTGFLRGRLGGALEAMNKVPQKQIAATSNMENVGSAIRLARSGTAVSKYELQNLGFIPTKNMPEEGVRTRLDELADNAERLLRTKLDMYEAAGLDLSGIRAKLNPFRVP